METVEVSNPPSTPLPPPSQPSQSAFLAIRKVWQRWQPIPGFNEDYPGFKERIESIRLIQLIDLIFNTSIYVYLCVFM